jgi:predicted small metal-binding protein
MARRYIDCRQVPGSTKGCTLALSADTEEELLAAAVQHGITVHGYKDTPEFRGQVRKNIRVGSPPA